MFERTHVSIYTYIYIYIYIEAVGVVWATDTVGYEMKGGVVFFPADLFRCDITEEDCRRGGGGT